MVGDISGFEYSMSEKRTQNFSGKIYFLDFGGNKFFQKNLFP